MEGIIHPIDTGFTVVTLSALGDLFLQSFEKVASDSYEGDGVAAFSSVDPDVKLGKKERRHLKKWLQSADDAVVDATPRNYVTPFVPSLSARIGEELKRKKYICSAALARPAHPACRRCHLDLVQEEARFLLLRLFPR